MKSALGNFRELRPRAEGNKSCLAFSRNAKCLLPLCLILVSFVGQVNSRSVLAGSEPQGVKVAEALLSSSSLPAPITLQPNKEDDLKATGRPLEQEPTIITATEDYSIPSARVDSVEREKQLVEESQRTDKKSNESKKVDAKEQEEEVSDSKVGAGAVQPGAGVTGRAGGVGAGAAEASNRQSNELVLEHTSPLSDGGNEEAEEKNAIRRFDVNILHGLPRSAEELKAQQVETNSPAAAAEVGYKKEGLDNLNVKSSSIDKKNQDQQQQQAEPSGPLSVIAGKSKYKSSTVYLNAEEHKRILGKEEEKIARVQLKKLVSIRNHVLELVKQESPQPHSPVQVPRTISQLLPIWKEEAHALQQQIRNETVLQQLKGEQVQVLPGIPKFSEQELLDVLKYLISSRRPATSSTPDLELYLTPGNTKASAQFLSLSRSLSKRELEILRCAEELAAGKQRQSLLGDVMECIRGLSVFNCMRIFVWPIILENLPESVGQNLPNLPIEFNLIDLFQGTNRQHSARTASPFKLPIFSNPQLTLVAQPLSYPYPYPYLLPYYSPSAVSVSARRPVVPFEADGTRSKESFNQLNDQRQPVWINCFQQLSENYPISCIRYLPWGTARQNGSWIPDFASLLDYFPNWAQITGAFASVPPLLPSIPDFSSFIPSLPTLPSLPGSIPTAAAAIPAAIPTAVPSSRQAASVPQETNYSPSQVEEDMLRILVDITKALEKDITYPPTVVRLFFTSDTNGAALPKLTKQQFDILELIENLLSPPLQLELAARGLSCLDRREFAECSRLVFWPLLRTQHPQLPPFSKIHSYGKRQPLLLPLSTPTPTPQESKAHNDQEQGQEEDLSESEGKRSSNIGGVGVEERAASSVPVIRVTGTRFVPIFSEQPESLILNILQSIGPTSGDVERNSGVDLNERLNQLLTGVQLNILRAAESLLPRERRPVFIERMVDCVERSSFLLCSRNFLWPTVIEYFPGLPTLPNFGRLSGELPSSSKLEQVQYPMSDIAIDSGGASAISTTSGPAAVSAEKGTASQSAEVKESPLNLTDPNRPLSETKVKTTLGQNGDATITITDTRFLPIFHDDPESVLLNILRAVEISMPHLPQRSASLSQGQRDQFAKYLTTEQTNIIEVATTLLPLHMRQLFLERMTSCAREDYFLNCMRDIVWPTVSQFFPRLPSFPNFPTLFRANSQTFPRTKSSLDDSPLEAQALRLSQLDQLEMTIEGLLVKLLQPESTELDSSKNADRPDVLFYQLTDRQVRINELVARGLPPSLRDQYYIDMLNCLNLERFLPCTERIGWPKLKELYPQLPDYPSPTTYQSPSPSFAHLFAPPQLASTSTPPGIGAVVPFPFPLQQLGQFPLTPAESSPQLPQIPLVPHLPQPPLLEVPQLPGGFPTPPDGLAQIPAALDGISGLPPFGLLLPSVVEATVDDAALPPASNGEPAAAASAAAPAAAISSTSTPSVGGAGTIPAYAGQPTANFLDFSRERVQSEDKSSPSPSPAENLQESPPLAVDTSIEPSSLSSNQQDSHNGTASLLTESKLLELLRSALKEQDKSAPTSPSQLFWGNMVVRRLTNESLSSNQYEILLLLAQLQNGQTQLDRSFLTRVMQCIRGLSFLRCIGIFAWPMIVSSLPLPSLPSLPIPFLRRSLLVTPTAVTYFPPSYPHPHPTYNDDVKPDVALPGVLRTSRATKIKDNKNLPSILTIISDIMEEVLDQRPDADKLKKDKDKSGRRRRSIDESSQPTNMMPFSLIRELRRKYLLAKNNSSPNSLQEGTKAPPRLPNPPVGSNPSHISHQEGTRAPPQLPKPKPHTKNNSSANSLQEGTRDPFLVENPLVATLRRGLKKKMVQFLPGISWLFSFLIQMALAHARTAASVAGMMSNMALGSATIGMLRETLFGSNTHPKIKYVYDNVGTNTLPHSSHTTSFAPYPSFTYSSHPSHYPHHTS